MDLRFFFQLKFPCEETVQELTVRRTMAMCNLKGLCTNRYAGTTPVLWKQACFKKSVVFLGKIQLCHL